MPRPRLLKIYIPAATLADLQARWPNTWRVAASNAVIDLVNPAAANRRRIAAAGREIAGGR